MLSISRTLLLKCFIKLVLFMKCSFIQMRMVQCQYLPNSIQDVSRDFCTQSSSTICLQQQKHSFFFVLYLFFFVFFVCCFFFLFLCFFFFFFFAANGCLSELFIQQVWWYLFVSMFDCLVLSRILQAVEAVFSRWLFVFSSCAQIVQIVARTWTYFCKKQHFHFPAV